MGISSDKPPISLNRAATSQQRSPLAHARHMWLALDASWLWALKLFLGYRVLFTVWAAWISTVFPRYAQEAAITIWPINASLDYWLQRSLLWPVARYDVIWYVGIAEHGYAYKPGST